VCVCVCVCVVDSYQSNELLVLPLPPPANSVDIKTCTGGRKSKYECMHACRFVGTHICACNMICVM